MQENLKVRFHCIPSHFCSLYVPSSIWDEQRYDNPTDFPTPIIHTAK
jgi:hypothetical protein